MFSKDFSVAYDSLPRFSKVIDFSHLRSAFRENGIENSSFFWIKNLGYVPFLSENFHHVPSHPDDMNDHAVSSLYAFNAAPEIGAFFYYIKKLYDIDIAIESGTNVGHSSRYFSTYFKEVHTVEVDNNYFRKSSNILKDCSNVHCHFGSSDKIFNKILPLLKNKRIFFWLDGHGCGPWPLLNELEEISKTHKNNCVITVDDFKIPGRPDIKFDKWNNQECSYEYISEKLNLVFSDYYCSYLVPANINARAKFIAVPKFWAN